VPKSAYPRNCQGTEKHGGKNPSSGERERERESLRHMSASDRAVNWSTSQLVKTIVNSSQILVNIVKMDKQKGQNWKLDKN